MTAYSDWIKDFPNRVLDLLDWYSEDARDNNREVTLLACVGGLLLSAPYERLRKHLDDTGQEVDHSQRERKKWFIGDFDRKMKRSFNDTMTEWRLHADLWQGGNLDDSDDPKDWDSWKDKQGRRLDAKSAWAPSPELKLENVMNTMRNALAHGQVSTYTGSSQISKLIFLSHRTSKNKPLTANQRDRLHKQLQKELPDDLAIERVMNVIKLQMQPEKPRYRFIAVPPDEWLAFLKCWANMLNKFEKDFSYISAA